jgi:hypothetical protein
MHTRLPIGSFIPSVVRTEAGKPHDSTMADELTKDMKGGDILLADRAYVDFAFLHNLTAKAFLCLGKAFRALARSCRT